MPRRTDSNEREPQDAESHAAQIYGAKLGLLTRLNSISSLMMVKMVTEAEEHAEELHGVAAQVQQWVWSSKLISCTTFEDSCVTVGIPVMCVWYCRVFHSTTSSTADALGIGSDNYIRNMTEEADTAANQSSEVAGQILEVGWLDV